ncbi:MAG: STM4012 family radical SAM protein [Saprospiraceae bacterium]
MTNTKNNIYQQYTYGYPHKHTYRFLDQAEELKTVWQKEDKSNLFAYLHIPFCEMRCGFCNLFTIANPKSGVGDYLNALQREALDYQKSMDEIEFEEYAIGGGTPTFLSVPELEKMLSIFKNDLGVNTLKKYGSIEASPKSISSEKIQLIEAYGINRISMGIQSWLEAETKLLGRPQSVQKVTQAVEAIKRSKVPEVNLDLIYGIHHQTKATWLYSLEKTIDYNPTEIFLYPLYTRPLTGLSKMQNEGEDNRLELFRIGREFLKANGYTQTSMRCFRKNDAPIIFNNYQSPTNGMIGIGAGARSYTKDLHYSTNYAVTRKATKAIIHDYSATKDFTKIKNGFYLNEEERMRRFLIKSLIDGGFLNPQEFKKQFGKDISEIDILDELFERKWLEEKNGFYQLNERGMELEDMIGPMFFSENVKKMMQEFELS